MNGKLIAVVIILVAGIGVGYAISLPQISSLRSEVSNLQSDYEELEANYTLLIESMDIRFIEITNSSMEPTLKIGDVVVVRRVIDTCEINATPAPDGDIIAYYSPTDPSSIIVHRAIDKINVEGVWYFITKGDDNPGPDTWIVSEDLLIGKVVVIIPKPS